MHHNTALRGYTARRIEEIDSADILVGIPCYNNESNKVVYNLTRALFGKRIR